MLRGIVTLASRDAALARPFAASAMYRGFASKIKEKGSADENVYFNQEDGKVAVAAYSFRRASAAESTEEGAGEEGEGRSRHLREGGGAAADLQAARAEEHGGADHRHHGPYEEVKLIFMQRTSCAKLLISLKACEQRGT